MPVIALADQIRIQTEAVHVHFLCARQRKAVGRVRRVDASSTSAVPSSRLANTTRGVE
jgi:hypothetical protein